MTLVKEPYTSWGILSQDSWQLVLLLRGSGTSSMKKEYLGISAVKNKITNRSQGVVLYNRTLQILVLLCFILFFVLFYYFREGLKRLIIFAEFSANGKIIIFFKCSENVQNALKHEKN